LAQKAKKDWVKELCMKNKVNFLSLQETKMEKIELFDIKRCWGNFAFEYVHSDSVGNMVMLIISVYAPQELTEKKMLWDYLSLVITNWKGEVIIMGDFNEVRNKTERFGSVFNAQGANAFNTFISSSGLAEVPFGGCSFKWCHKSATKMSKLDRFLISERLMSSCPNISVISLDRFLSDHRPILLREFMLDYGPTPFHFFHYWIEVDGFVKMVEDTWNVTSGDSSNAIFNLMNKLKFLKQKIRAWNFEWKNSSKSHLVSSKLELAHLDALIDSGEGTEATVQKRTTLVDSILKDEKLHSMKVAQKAKIKWAIEGDENSKFYHGILNNKRNQLSIQGVLVDGIWIEN
nr:RNA-directed DNA polymerase, eukaryota [Tanacetum cinerariifolium]